MEPSHGVIVLEIQDRIMSFLVRCCKLILHDTDTADFRVPHKPNPGHVVTTRTGYPTVAGLAAEAPYRLPQKLDLKRLHVLVKGKRDEAEERIWSLREIPSQLVDSIKESADHTPPTTLDEQQKAHRCVGTPDCWTQITLFLIKNNYYDLIAWHELETRLSGMCIW